MISLAHVLKGGQGWLSEARKATVLKIPAPHSRSEDREFLGSAGFYCLWIPSFAELAKLLNEAQMKAGSWMVVAQAF